MGPILGVRQECSVHGSSREPIRFVITNSDAYSAAQLHLSLMKTGTAESSRASVFKAVSNL